MNRFIRQLQGRGFVLALLILVAIPLSVVADDVEKVSELVLNAEDALKEHQYQEAASDYRKAAGLSDDPEVAQQATRIGYSYGFNKDALASAKRWAHLEPESDEALLYVAQLNLRTGAIRDSQKSFEKLLERGEEPVDQRLLALIPFLSQEDPALSYELMLKLARPYKGQDFLGKIR